MLLFHLLAVLAAVLSGTVQAKLYLLETASTGHKGYQNRRLYPQPSMTDKDDSGPVQSYPSPKMTNNDDSGPVQQYYPNPPKIAPSPGCKVHPDEPWNFSCS